MARLQRHRWDAESVFRRFATKDPNGPRPWEGHAWGTGQAVRCELAVCEEDIGPAAAKRPDGAAGAAGARPGEQDHPCDGSLTASTVRGRVGPHSCRVAAGGMVGTEGVDQPGAVMASVAADGPPSEKKSIYAREQDSEEGRRRRQAWREQIASIDPRRLVFVDESGATTEMTRRYGRAPGGQAAREATPAGHWRTLTVLGAMSADGLIATMTIEAPTDREVFLSYLEEVLCPRL